jgi:putative ABC transport system permease protein
LKEGVSGTSRVAAGNLFRRLLIASEVALTFVLLVAAGLMIRSIVQLLHVDPGFDPRHLMQVKIELPLARYQDFGRRQTFCRQIAEQISALPGFVSVAIVAGGGGMEFTVEGQQTPFMPSVINCSPGSHDYLQTMGIPLLDGRSLADEAVRGDSNAILVNEAMVRRLWPNENPIGKRIRSSGGAPWLTVVGIVKNTRLWSYVQDPQPTLYQPLNWVNPLRAPPSHIELVVRTTADPLDLAKAVRLEVQGLDKDLPVSEFRKFETTLAETSAERRFYMTLLNVFASIGVLFSVAGIYGVLSHFVEQRTHEIGVRMALGAERSAVLWLVVKHGMAWVSAGLAVGYAGALALTRLISSQLYAVKPTDAVTFACVSLLLVGVALLACVVPARRAAKVDPMVALRYE